MLEINENSDNFVVYKNGVFLGDFDLDNIKLIESLLKLNNGQIYDSYYEEND